MSSNREHPKSSPHLACAELESRKIREAISPHSTVEFGQIPEEHWSLPPWINKADSDRTLQSMGKAGVKYGGTCFHLRIQ